MSSQPTNAEPSGVDLYVESFIKSSQLVRYALITVAITSVLLFVGHRNSAEHSWFNSRIDLAHYAIDYKVWTFGPGVLKGRAELARKWAVARHLKSQLDIEVHLQALEDARVNRVILLGVPFFGVTHDVNDLGFLGGIALLVLVAILKYAMSRQHENLYLALYRVRQIFKQEGGVPRPDGQANLIYHSLAMSQQFTQPPSLARWGPIRRLGFSWLLLPLPLAVQAFGLYHDWTTRSVGLILNAGATKWSLWTQSVSLALVSLLTGACFLYCRSNDERWRKTFFTINPNLLGRKQPTWPEWVQLVSRREDYCSEYHQGTTDTAASQNDTPSSPRPVG